jgi:hypothetical protein
MKLLSVLAVTLLVSLCAFIHPAHRNARMPGFRLKFVYDTAAFTPGGDTLGYKPGQKIAWTDFKGTVPAGASAVANSAVGFKFAAAITVNETDDVNLTITAASYFVKSRSWVKQEDKNDYILRHEQLHFDIARLAADRFRQIITTKKMTENEFNNVFNAVYKQVWSEYQAEQAQYDKETNHSILKAEQARWEEKVAARILALP